MKLPACYPILRSDRLLLRALALTDACVVRRLAGAVEIAQWTLTVPHPYEEGMAEQWIRPQAQRFQAGQIIEFAMVLHETNSLCGAIGLKLDPAQDRAELGYWVGVPYWGNGLCTEAAGLVAGWMFASVEARRIVAHHFARNPASGRVLQKVGFSHEGTLRNHIRKGNRFEDVEIYGLLSEDWANHQLKQGPTSGLTGGGPAST